MLAIGDLTNLAVVWIQIWDDFTINGVKLGRPGGITTGGQGGDL